MGLKVLVVDDDPNFCTSFSDTLIEKGNSVDFALSGQEALNKLKRGDYKIIFVDMKMPEMDGSQTVKESKKLKPDITVIGITGYDDYELVKNAIDNGARGCIYKPVDYLLIDEILHKISQEE